MSLHQLGFDFFNEPAEEKPIAKKPVSREQLLKEAATGAVANTKDETPQATEEISAEPIVVDETIREVSFVAEEPVVEVVKSRVAKTTERKSTRGRMKLADMDVLVDLVEVPEDELLFQKRY